MLLLLLLSCKEDDGYMGLRYPDNAKEEAFQSHPLRIRHADSKLKILAIGNSFTDNASTFLPGLVDILNEDSVCVVKLCRPSASLSMHWKNHLKNSSDYIMYYSERGKWVTADDITTIDDALNILDWDIIVIQQVSGYAGKYDTFQPFLDNLVALFRESNPNVKIAFHYTWAYFPWTEHPDFSRYDYNCDTMYFAIMEACERASEKLDLIIPSATLVRDMRQEFADEEEAFSTDGFHIYNPFVEYALSSLWYESLVTPFMGTSSLYLTTYPDNIDSRNINKIFLLIENILNELNH